MSRRRMAAATQALAIDFRLLARFVDRWRADQPCGLNTLAWELDNTPIGEAKVAILMKAATQDGLVTRTSPHGDQGTWAPTDRLLTMFPEHEAHVMPEIEYTTKSGMRVQAVSGDEARTWGTDTGDHLLGPPAPRQRHLR